MRRCLELRLPEEWIMITLKLRSPLKASGIYLDVISPLVEAQERQEGFPRF